MGVVYAGYDIMLDRKVALKLVRRQLLDNPAIRARMLREAQAMARLSNPHVVQVYQVGEHDESIYVAMEYIDGRTLGAWLKAERRPWQLVLRTVCDAGRGLAAAHSAGLVHRDFKPDNVLVDAEGHARVLDFGLVRAEGDSPVADEESATTGAYAVSPHETLPIAAEVERTRLHWSVRLTQRGNSLGTPAYMSPEQHFGHMTGPHSDQFSFAITLYEALYGVRPFVGDTWAKIRLQVQAGVFSPPLDSPVPRRVFKVLARALATAPQDRWPDLDEMIRALERDAWRTPLRIAAVVALLGVASAASYTAAMAQVPESRRCESAAGELAGVWEPAQQDAVSRAFAATRDPFAGDAWVRVQSRLDGYTKAWIDERRVACEANASGMQTARMMDLRIACLGRRRAHLEALIEVFTAADSAVVENAVQAVAALPSVHACSDPDVLHGATAPPDDPETALRVGLLRGQLARAQVLEDTGRFEEGLQLATRARREAESLGYAPAEAEAALVEGSLEMAAARSTEAHEALTHALRLGIAHDLHAVAAEAATRQIFVVGVGLGRRTEALATEAFAEALAQRAGGDGRLAALLHNNLGAVYDLQGAFAVGRAHYEQTIAVLDRRPGPPDPLLAITHNNLGNMESDRGDFDAARIHFVAAQRLFTRILGDAHPFVAHALAGLGDADVHTGAYASAKTHYLQALARMEAAYGPEHMYLMQPLHGLGRVHAALGQPDEAERSFARAVEIAGKQRVADIFHAQSLMGLAALAEGAGARERARELYRQAAHVYDETGNNVTPLREVDTHGRRSP